MRDPADGAGVNIARDLRIFPDMDRYRSFCFSYIRSGVYLHAWFIHIPFVYASISNARSYVIIISLLTLPEAK